MFIVPEPVFPRTRLEKVFRFVYAIGTIINLAALVITIASYSYRLNRTYTQFSGSSAILHPNLAVLLTSCSYDNIPVSLGGLEATTSMNAAAAPWAFLSTTWIIVGVMVLMFFILINDVMAKACFVANVRNFRMRGISIPINTICANAMLVQTIGELILVGASTNSRDLLNNYVQHCMKQFATTNLTQFITLENNVQSVWGTNLNLIVIACAINLAIYGAAFVALCIEGFSDAQVEFENRKLFWEGDFCVPDKTELFHYSRWRQWALNEIGIAQEHNNGDGSSAGIELAPVSYLEFMQDLENAKQNWMDQDPDQHISGVGDEQEEDEGGDGFHPSGAGGDARHPTSPAAAAAAAGRRGAPKPAATTGGGRYSTTAGASNTNTGAAPPQAAAAAPGFGNVYLGGGNAGGGSDDVEVADEPEELMLPETMEPEDEFYDKADMYVPKSVPSAYGGGDGGIASSTDPYYSRAASYQPTNAGHGGGSQQPDRPYSSDLPFVSQQQQQQQPYGETEEERRERHRLRRMTETAEEREARKERRRRLKEQQQQQQMQQDGYYRSSSIPSPPWRGGSNDNNTTGGARYGLASRALPAPAPSP